MSKIGAIRFHSVSTEVIVAIGSCGDGSAKNGASPSTNVTFADACDKPSDVEAGRQRHLRLEDASLEKNIYGGRASALLNVSEVHSRDEVLTRPSVVPP
jgi:hypothetical protein